MVLTAFLITGSLALTQTRSWSSSSSSNTVNGKTTHEGWSKQNSGQYNHETGQGSFKGAADDWAGNFNHNTQKGWMDGNSQGWNGAMTGNYGGPTQFGPVKTWENPWSGPWNGQPGKNGQKPDIGVEGDADATCEDVLAHAEKMKAMLKEMGATGCEQMQAVLDDLANSINSIEYLDEDNSEDTPEEMPEEMPEEIPDETTQMPPVETTHKPHEMPVETTTPMPEGEYDPCKNLAEGGQCKLCPPNDTNCVETMEVKFCHQGQCQSMRSKSFPMESTNPKPEEMPEGEGLGRSFGARLGSSYHPNLQDYLGRSHKLGAASSLPDLPYGQYAPKNARGNWKFWEWFDSSEEGDETEENSDSNDLWDWIGDGADIIFDWDSNDSEEKPQGLGRPHHPQRRLDEARRLEKRSAF